MIHFTENRVPDRVLRWVVDSVDPQAVIQSTRRLQGGISSIVHSISMLVGEEVRNLVLRQFDNTDWLHKEPDLALHEAGSLQWAERAALPAPKIVAYDESGDKCGIPAVLMTQLEGTVVLQPSNRENWLDGMAEALVSIHVLEADEFLWSYFTYNNVDTLEVPNWTSIPDSWSDAIKLVRMPRPLYKPCFIHRDYHPANVLWSQNKVSGVVDWVNSCRGPAGIDVGHCRLNLALLYDVPTADGFLSAYQRHAGLTFTYDPYWDLLSLIEVLFGPPKVYPGWTALGVTGLTDELMKERLDTYLGSLLELVRERTSS